MSLDSIEYEVQYSARRKTISLQVKHGKVRVLAPKHVSLQYIEQLVDAKKAWLLSKIDLHKSLPKPTLRQYVAGETYYFLGEPFTLDIEEGGKDRVQLQQDRLLVTFKSLREGQSLSDKVSKLLLSWYKQQAKLHLSARLEAKQNHTSLKPKSFSIRYFKSRWGSCDSKQHVKLNWMLVMSPIAVIDYVIVHELCHLKHMDHSRQFWQLVEKHGGQHKFSKLWLAEHRQHLYWQN